ncbi:unnamed protein product [Phyllotreta striolata]|uniref:DUF1907 domain-containing protein n=1 Tax=Phyllotreta striolata TaxID=444603 RepID=A0A9N9TX50_PHYSR|nr:unnamed protein product [Phyllotreta striolata]
MNTIFSFIFHLLILIYFPQKNMALNPNSIPVESKKLFVPPLSEVAEAINNTLKTNFAEVSVEVVDCPDLRQQPFTLASEGLGGNTKIIELGGNPYLLPEVHREKYYDLKDIAKLVNSNPSFIIGAGAGPNQYVGVNCEGVYNVMIADGEVVNQSTRISKVDSNDDKSIQEILPKNETRLALLGNLFFSEGKPGKVLKVHAKKRTGDDNFITSIRKAIVAKYNDLVGIGGVFLMKEGKGKFHVMRDFSKTPIQNEEQLNKWLKFYNFSAPLVSVGTLVNSDGGELDLRVQHFHTFSHHGEAGHYHYDTTPEEVEYLGFFNVGEMLYRIDKPVNTHNWGRD